MTKYHRQWFGWSSELGCIQNGIKLDLNTQHDNHEICHVSVFLLFGSLHSLAALFDSTVLDGWGRLSSRENITFMNQPTTQWGRRSFPCNGLRRVCVSELFLTKITMQETQHGQRIYHLVGGLKTILRNMSIQWEGLCHICLKKKTCSKAP